MSYLQKQMPTLLVSSDLPLWLEPAIGHVEVKLLSAAPYTSRKSESDSLGNDSEFLPEM